MCKTNAEVGIVEWYAIVCPVFVAISEVFQAGYRMYDMWMTDCLCVYMPIYFANFLILGNF